MPGKVRIRLATKLQVMVGLAVLLMLSVSLVVLGYRFKQQAQETTLQQARQLVSLLDAGLVRVTPHRQNTLENTAQPQTTPPRIYQGKRSDLSEVVAMDPSLAEALDLARTASSREVFDELTASPYVLRYVARQWTTQDDTDKLSDRSDPTFWVVYLPPADDRSQGVVNGLYITAAAAAGLLIAIAGFWLIVNRLMLTPLGLLRSFAQKVSHGDTHLRCDINTGDEFEELAHMLNTLLENLKTQQEALRSANKTLDMRLGELAESNVSLYEANKLKGEFLANVSHELRTPLNSIIGFAEVLQETLASRTGPVDEKRKRYTSHIITSSRLLLDLINDLLDLAKIESGRMDLYVSTVSLPDLAEALITLIGPVADRNGVDLRVKIEPRLPTIETDPGKLHQVIFNLLSNAVKFTPEQGWVELSVQAQRGGDNDVKHVSISVRDTGPGIAAADQQRVFEKFTQLDGEVTRAHGGTGLGLTISKELSQMLQGELRVESVPGEGACFTLTLPMVVETRSAPLMPLARSMD